MSFKTSSQQEIRQVARDPDSAYCLSNPWSGSSSTCVDVAVFDLRINLLLCSKFPALFRKENLNLSMLYLVNTGNSEPSKCCPEWTFDNPFSCFALKTKSCSSSEHRIIKSRTSTPFILQKQQLITVKSLRFGFMMVLCCQEPDGNMPVLKFQTPSFHGLKAALRFVTRLTRRQFHNLLWIGQHQG